VTDAGHLTTQKQIEIAATAQEKNSDVQKSLKFIGKGKILVFFSAERCFLI